MSLGSLRYLPATRGTLLKLRRRLQVVRRGKEILEMRRDQIIQEVFVLVNKIREREKIEEEILSTINELLKVKALRRGGEFETIAGQITPPKVKLLYVSYQGIPVPQVKVVKDPETNKVKDPEISGIIHKLWSSFKKLLEIVNIELAVEKLLEYLSYINRIVNSLERNIIPQLEETIRYIEEKIDEEMISEFVVLKRISQMLRERRRI